MKTKISIFCLLLSLLGPLSHRAPAAEGPPVASPPPDLVLGDYGFQFGNIPSDELYTAYDTTSGKLFVSAYEGILRFSVQSQLTDGGLPEAVFKVNNVGGLAIDSNGRLWVASSNRVLRFDNAAGRPADMVPDGVLGQPDPTSTKAAAGPEGMNGPKSLAVDSSGLLWVADTGNNRVLGFVNAAAKINGAPADLLLGQPNWTNTGTGLAATRMTGPTSLAVDSTGRLWAVDNQTRILRFDNAASKAHGAPADGVLGHSDFLGSLPADPGARFRSLSLTTGADDTLYLSSQAILENQSGEVLSSAGVLRYETPWQKPNGAPPDGKFLPWPEAAALPGLRKGLGRGPAGSLWIPTINTSYGGTLLRIDDPGTASGNTAPDGILGAVSLYPASARTLSSPQSVIEEAQSGKVFVADTGNNRVLRYPSIKTLNSGAPAEAVFGQPDFLTRDLGTGPGKMNSPQGLAIDAAGNLFVSDSSNHRVLRFLNAIWSPAGTPAIAALGQPDLSTNTRRPPSEFTLRSPGPLTLGPGGELWVSELEAETTKVVRFDQAASAASGAAASGVLGRVDFYDQQSPSAGSSTLFKSIESIFCETSGRLWVASNAGFAMHLYRFDLAAAKPNGAPSDATTTLELVKAAGITFAPSKPLNGSAPSIVAGTDGKLILFFRTAYTFSASLSHGYVMVLGDPEELPSVLNQPSQVESVMHLPGWFPNYLHQPSVPVGLASSTDGFIWLADGLSSAKQFELPPFEPASDDPQVSPDLIQAGAEEVLALRFASIPGRDYQLLRSANLADWLPVKKLSATGTSTVLLENPASGTGFFKVMQLP